MIALDSYPNAHNGANLPSLCFPQKTLTDFRPLSLGDLAITLLSPRDTDFFVEAVAIEVGALYPETGEQYAHQIIKNSSGAASGLADTSLCKLVLGCYRAGKILGFTVVTPKRGHRIKFGPTIVLPPARGLGVARLLRKAGEEHFRRLGFLYSYSTCREDNLAARAYVSRAGYQLVGTLHGQYSPHISELVYAKRLSRTSNCNVSLNDPNHEEQPLNSFVLKLKRGGAAKILISTWAVSRTNLLGTIDYAVGAAQREGIRRVYLQLPSYVPAKMFARYLDFKIEGLGLPDESTGSGVLIARTLER